MLKESLEKPLDFEDLWFDELDPKIVEIVSHWFPRRHSNIFIKPGTIRKSMRGIDFHHKGMRWHWDGEETLLTGRAEVLIGAEKVGYLETKQETVDFGGWCEFFYATRLDGTRSPERTTSVFNAANFLIAPKNRILRFLWDKYQWYRIGDDQLSQVTEFIAIILLRMFDEYVPPANAHMYLHFGCQGYPRPYSPYKKGEQQ